MNGFPSDTLYRAQLARNQVLLSEAAAERHARSVHKVSSVYDGATRLVVFALRRRSTGTSAVTRRVAAAD